MAGKPTIDRRLDSDSGRESQEAGRGQRTTVAPTSASPCGREAPMHMLRIVQHRKKKEKFRLIYGHFEKFKLLYKKRKVQTHIWQKKSLDSYLVHLIKFRLFYDINPYYYLKLIFKIYGELESANKLL